MAGHVRGVQKRIREKYLRAIFVHCAAHCLNLKLNIINNRVEFLFIVKKSIFLYSFLPGGQKNTGTSGYLNLTSSLLILDALTSLLGDLAVRHEQKLFP